MHVFGTALPAQRRRNARKARTAFPCLNPLTCSQLSYSCPPALARSSQTCLVSSTAIGCSPSFGTTHAPVCGQGTVTGSVSQPLFPCTQLICPQASLKHLFVSSLTARLKSSYHRQRKRNILQVCNSLKHWTCSNMSLLLGRKEDMFRLRSTMTHL